MGELVEVAIAAGGDEGCEEDGEVVAGVDEGGCHDGAKADADCAEDERDAEEKEQDGPCECRLLTVQCGEENAGEYGREDEARQGDFVGRVPEFAGGGSAGERKPVVGDGEGWKQEAAEEDLFEEGRQEDAEDGDEPDVGWGAEEVVHWDLFGH